MKKVTLTTLVIFSSFMCVFGNTERGYSEINGIPETDNAVILSCGASASGTLSCGMGFSACADNAAALALILHELECYACQNQTSCNELPPHEP